MMDRKRIWITWENHRRSTVLSDQFMSTLFVIDIKASRLKRYFVSSIKTIALISRESPDIVFCQNPSIVLASLLVILKFFFNYNLIIDRHSNFKFEMMGKFSLKWKFFEYLSIFTIKNADLTLVTNDVLRKYCLNYSDNVLVLPDKIPKLNVGDLESDLATRNPSPGKILFVTTFDDDEPIEAMLGATQLLKDFSFFFTGNFKKRYSARSVEDFGYTNVNFMGFIDDEAYIELMEYADVVVVLTEKDLILNCGAYEAISFSKPLVLSDTPTLKSYFGSAAIYTQNNEDDLAKRIRSAFDNRASMIFDVKRRRVELESEWEYMKTDVENNIIELTDNK